MSKIDQFTRIGNDGLPITPALTPEFIRAAQSVAHSFEHARRLQTGGLMNPPKVITIPVDMACDVGDFFEVAIAMLQEEQR